MEVAPYSATAESRIRELERIVNEIKQYEITLWNKIEAKHKNTIILENLKLEFEYEKSRERWYPEQIERIRKEKREMLMVLEELAKESPEAQNNFKRDFRNLKTAKIVRETRYDGTITKRDIEAERRRDDEEVRKRKEIEDLRKREEEEKKRLEEKKHKDKEDEEKRKFIEDERRKREAEEKRKIVVEEQNRRETEEKHKRDEEQKHKRDEEEKRKRDEEEKLRLEEEARKKKKLKQLRTNREKHFH